MWLISYRAFQNLSHPMFAQCTVRREVEAAGSFIMERCLKALPTQYRSRIISSERHWRLIKLIPCKRLIGGHVDADSVINNNREQGSRWIHKQSRSNPLALDIWGHSVQGNDQPFPPLERYLKLNSHFKYVCPCVSLLFDVFKEEKITLSIDWH